MKKILLTGGNGFIGCNIRELLGANYNFFYPGHKNLNLLNAYQVREYLTTNKFDVIIHAAGTAISRGQTGVPDILESNKQMFFNLAENSKLFGRMIFLGSGAEYGKQRSIIRVKESEFGQVIPQDEYGRAKYAASEYIAEHENIMNLRCFGVFGKYEDYTTRFISNIICQSLAGQPIVVNQNTVFDYIYINDLVKIIAYFTDFEPKEKFYNVGRGEGTELLTLANIVKELTDSPYDIRIKQPGLGKEYTCDNSKLLKELGNFQFTPFKQSIKELVDWYKNNRQNIDVKNLSFDAYGK